MEQKVTVWDRNENVLAIFTNDDINDEDKMLNPMVNLIQNGENTFSFQLPLKSEKWKQIQAVDNFYLVNGHVYSPKFDGGYVKDLNENNEELITVNCFERQNLLQRKYVRAWNSETGFEKIDDYMVVILSNGDLPLKNNDTLVNPTYQKGSAGYILEGLLFGSGWTVGEVDVTGTYDFETDMTSIYDNVLKVQEMFGGILVFDSLNKIVHLRDEEKYVPNTGYEVRRKKNMASSSNIYNNKIITRVIPLGEGGLNIKSVNNGLSYLENTDYSPIITEEIINNDSIYDVDQLKAWGERKLKEMSKPTKELTVKLIDLRTTEGYELEEFDLNDVVNVIYDNGIDENETLRVISWQYNVFSIFDSTIELGDTVLNTTDIFKQISKVTDDINNGTVSATKIINKRTGETLEGNITRIDETVITNEREQRETNASVSLTLKQHADGIDNLHHETINLGDKIAILSATVESITQSIQISGGTNKVINSVGLYGTDKYTITTDLAGGSTYFGEDANLKTNTYSGAKVSATNSTITHRSIDSLRLGNIYTITFKICNDASNSLKFTMTGTMPYDDTEYVSYDETTGIVTIVDTTEAKNFQEFVYKFKVIGDVTYTLKCSYEDNTKSGFYTDLIIKDGDVRSNWESSSGEIIGTALTIYYNGIEVTSPTSSIKTVINNTGFSVLDLTNIDKSVLLINNAQVVLGVNTTIRGMLILQDFIFQEMTVSNRQLLFLT